MHTGWNTDALTSRKKGMKAMYVKGVNLGNWLVLEKWMSPALFEGTTAEDEYYLARQLPPGVYEAPRTHARSARRKVIVP